MLKKGRRYNLLISYIESDKSGDDISGTRLYFISVSALRCVIKQISHAPHERKAGFVSLIISHFPVVLWRDA